MSFMELRKDVRLAIDGKVDIHSVIRNHGQRNVDVMLAEEFGSFSKGHEVLHKLLEGVK